MRRTIIIAAVFVCGVAAQQLVPNPKQMPENATLTRQVHDLQKRVDELETRLRAVEQDTRYRVSPAATRP